MAASLIPDPSLFVLDTLGKLHMHGHGIGGYCLICQRLFSVTMVALIAERGEGCQVRGMKPLTCPGCQGKRTQFSITAPSKSGISAAP